MTPTQTARMGKRQWVRNLALVGIVLVVARFLMLRGQPERLPDAPFGVLQNGWTYWQADGPGGSVIYAQRVTGGTAQPIVRESLQNMIVPLSPGDFEITPSTIYYTVMPRPPKTNFIGSPGAGSISPVVFAGTFRPSAGKLPSKQTSHEKRAALQFVPITHSSEHLRRVPLQGGAPQDALKIDGINETIVGDNVFWIAPKPDEAVEIQNGNERRVETIGHSDLMVTPLNGGAARKLFSGLSMNTLLSAGTDGVYWREPHAYPDHHIDLYRFRATDTKPLVVKDYNDYFNGQSAPTEYQGRLYWLGSRRDPNKEKFSGAVEDCLMSMNTDGSDRRMLPEPIDGMKMPRSPLTIHRGRLYFVYVDIVHGREEYYLYRLHPGPDGKGEIVRKLPTGAESPRFDGDYVYFNVMETHKSLLDWLMQDDAHEVRKVVSYRLRLPD